ncbi:serine/threonine-protein kinase [Gemmatimonas sp.]|uniref:serine/threonine-protein kinase n=1 Tax=Gemmatimonas sp. TaxID=1962908 RepID=UPI0039830EA2
MPDRYLGQTISKYQITRLLGSGAFSWVYEAIDLDLEIPVALKILRPEFSGLEIAEARFRREAATAARLRHRNIVTVRDVGQVDGTVFVAMDLHPLTLGRRLALAGRLPEADCIRLGTDVAAALAIAHAGGVIHRDIKPDNILLGTEGEAVVADFGLARALAGAPSLSATNQVMGTPHYFSPEQARGQEIDGRSDLYALGVTLYRAATGHLPFEGDDWYAVARHHIETTPTSPHTFAPELSPEFEAVMLRLLAKQPEQRYQSATQLLDALAALSRAPTRSGFTPPLGSHTIDAFPAVRASTGRAAVVGTLLVIGAAFIWFSLRNRSDMPALGGGTTFDSASLTVPPTPGSQPIADNPLGARVVPLRDSVAARATPPPVGGSLLAAPSTRPTRAAPARTARVEIFAPDSARLYIDNRLVGTGHYSGDFSAGSKLSVRAVIASASTSCTVAVRDTMLALKAGDRVSVNLPVRGCAVVSYDVTPRDARVTFTPLDGGAAIELRADSARALSLPEGRYEVRIQAPRCVMGTDTLQVAGRADGTPITRRFPLICS